MKDHVDPRQSFLYRLSQAPGLEHFQNVLLCGSSQDNYVPIHSAHMELCSAAVADSSVYGEVTVSQRVHVCHDSFARAQELRIERW